MPPEEQQDQGPLRDNGTLEVTSHYLRDRNFLAVEAELEPLYVDYYLHLMEYQIRPDPAHDLLLKELLAALTLHLTTRPREEATAWTVNLNDPALNLFVTGDSISGNITGRIFTENVRSGRNDLFYSQVTRPGEETRQSMVKVEESTDALKMVEHYYDQSEQLPSRIYRLPDEKFLMIAGMPDCDEEWLAQLDQESASKILKDEPADHMETRPYQFGCGCTVAKILPAIEGLARSDMDGLFQGDPHLDITCPRCGAAYIVSRSDLENWLKNR